MLSWFSASTLYHVTSGWALSFTATLRTQAFHKTGVAVGPLRARLLVLPFQQGVQLRTGRAFNDRNQVLDPHRFPRADLHRHLAPLVVGAVGRDRFGAG